MPPLKEEDREARLPLYLQRLRKQLQDPLPSEEDLAYYELCILCYASRDQSEPWLTEASLSTEKFQLFTKLKSRGEKFVEECCFEKNPYEMIPAYVRSASLPPIPWRSALKTAAPPLQDGTTLGSATQLSSPTKKSFIAQSSRTGASKLPGGTTVRHPDNVRRLRKIERLDMGAFEVKVAAYVASLPVGFQSRRKQDGSESIVKRNIGKEHLSIPAFSFHTATEVSEVEAPKDEYGVQAWVARLAGKTSETLLHLCDSRTKAYRFSDVVGKGTKGERSDLCWQQETVIDDEESGTPTRPLRRLVIEVKTPWALDPVTFRHFVQEDHLPTADELTAAQGSSNQSTRNSTARVSFSKVQKIWAQVYDYCVTQANYFFVLTSYEFWVFGVFSADYTSAQVTDPVPYDSKKPTVLACLMYWTQSAMLVPDLHEIPWVSDEREPLEQISSTTLKDASVLNLRAAKAIAAGKIMRAVEDAIITVLVDDVRLHRSRMSILTCGKPNENPWATAQRFMKNLGISLDEGEQKFSKMWDQLERRMIAKTDSEEQEEGTVSGGANDVESTMHLIERDFMLQNPLPPTVPAGVERTEVVKEEDPDLNDISVLHGSVTPSHGFKVPLLNHFNPRQSAKPSLQRGRGWSQSSLINEVFQPSWPKPDQLPVFLAPLVDGQATSSTSTSTPVQVEPAQDFRSRTSEHSLCYPSHNSFRSSSPLEIKSEGSTPPKLNEQPCPSYRTTAQFPAINSWRASNREIYENIGQGLPSIYISTAEHLAQSFPYPPTVPRKDRMVYPSVTSTSTPGINPFEPWSEAHQHPPFTLPIQHVDGLLSHQFATPSNDPNLIQPMSSLPTFDKPQNAITYIPSYPTFEELPPEAGMVFDPTKMLAGEASENPDIAAHPSDHFHVGLYPSPATNADVSLGLSRSWPSTPGSGRSVLTPSVGSAELNLSNHIAEPTSFTFDAGYSILSQDKYLGLDVGGCFVGEPRDSTPSKRSRSNSNSGLEFENVTLGDSRAPNKKLRQE